MPLAVHHIALKVADVLACANFYETVLELPIAQHHYDNENNLRSIWLKLGKNSILMIERAATSHAASPQRTGVGWHLLALSIKPTERSHWRQRLAHFGVPIIHESDYTLYVNDPEGNPIGLSHWPTGIEP